MKIKSMTASFGKLKHQHMELGDGLHLIKAPNEAGKSTWCAFLRAMLYGVPTRERDRQGYLAEKNRYQPWDGSPMEGELALTWQGRDVTIRRGPKGSVPFGSFSAVYTDTGEAVPGLTGENCGETLLGVSREVYERSAFVGQGGAAIGADAELERRIAALVSSGEEDVSFSEVEKRLKDWRNRRKFNKSGLIPKLENELAVLNDTLLRQERSHALAEEARREIETLTGRKKTLSAALEVYRQEENRGRYEKYQAARTALDEARADVSALEEQAGRTPDAETLREAQGELSYYNTLEANRRLAESRVGPARAEADELAAEAEDERFSGMSPDEAWQQASRDRDRAAAKAKRGPLFVGTIALFGAAVAWFAYLAIRIVLKQDIQEWMYWVLVSIGMFIITANTVNASKMKKWQAETDALLEKYGAQYPDDIITCANAYREKCVAAQEGQRKAEAVERSVAELAAQKEALLRKLLDTVHGFEPGVTDLFGVSAAISRGLGLREKLTAAQVRLEGAKALAESLPRPEGENPQSRLCRDSSLCERSQGTENPCEGRQGTEEARSPEQLAAELAAVEGELGRRKNDLARATGELDTLGDSALFEARREELREELERRGEEYEAIDLALEALGGANTALRERFSPALNERAGELLAALTGGKYHKLGLNRQFEAEAHEAGATLPRSSIALSQGTAEQVYLAVRLAVCELVLPAGESVPLVLDDALDAFDDTRMALALECLLSLSKERQILLFSSHSREAAWLEGKAGADVLSLQS